MLMRRGRRHDSHGLELLLLRRGAGAKFMPGVWVFAGGIVDPGDFDADDPPVEHDREEWAHRVAGARELGEEGRIEIGPGGLLLWSRWITPEVVPVRFDTRFYVALAPPHAQPEPDGVEMDEARWIGPDEALRGAEAGEMEISFPTTRHLEELATFTSIEEVMAAARERVGEPILPRVRIDGDSFEIVLPGEAGYED